MVQEELEELARVVELGRGLRAAQEVVVTTNSCALSVAALVSMLQPSSQVQGTL
jgi:hypothetical protein